MRITAGLVPGLLVIAVVLFLLAALEVSFQFLLALGLAFLAAAFAADRLMRATE